MQTSVTVAGWPPRVNVLGVGISVIDMRRAVKAIDQALAARERGYVCVTGVHGVTEACESADVRSILNAAFLCTPDGMPMVWVGRARGFAEMSRVYGPDLMLEVFRLSELRGYSHFLYGGANGTAERLRERLERMFPAARITGTYEPPFRPLEPEEEEALIARVGAARPDIIWVGLSTPKQERFMAQYLPRLDTTLMFGVGAAFDIHAGLKRQAPRWMQRAGLESFFRLASEPRRLGRRYLRNNPLFLVRIAAQFTGLRQFPLDPGESSTQKGRS